MARIISTLARKGGVGKTVTASNLAAALALSGVSVLGVDADPQGHFGAVLGVETNPDPDSPRRFAFLLSACLATHGAADLALHAVTVGPNLRLVPGDEISREAERLIASRAALLQAVSGFRAAADALGVDYVVIDSGPRGALQDFAAAAADVCVIPARCDYLGASAAFDALALTDTIRGLTGRRLVSWVLPTMYSGRERDSRRSLAGLSAELGDRLLGPVPMRVKVSESIAAGVPIVRYDPDSDAAIAYLTAVDVITGRRGEYVEVNGGAA